MKPLPIVALLKTPSSATIRECKHFGRPISNAARRDLHRGEPEHSGDGSGRSPRSLLGSSVGVSARTISGCRRPASRGAHTVHGGGISVPNHAVGRRRGKAARIDALQHTWEDRAASFTPQFWSFFPGRSVRRGGRGARYAYEFESFLRLGLEHTPSASPPTACPRFRRALSGHRRHRGPGQTGVRRKG